MKIQQGWLTGIAHCPSNHFDARPKGGDIDLLVIHNISLPPGEFGGGHIQAFFTDKLDASIHSYFSSIQALKVASHLLIERGGEVTQFVSFEDRAWHAGRSEFHGRANCNDYSIGIELEGTDDLPYTDHQYEKLTKITQLLMGVYKKITKDHIAGHCDIAPDRKTDPGPAFDWTRYLSQL